MLNDLQGGGIISLVGDNMSKVLLTQAYLMGGHLSSPLFTVPPG